MREINELMEPEDGLSPRINWNNITSYSDTALNLVRRKTSAAPFRRFFQLNAQSCYMEGETENDYDTYQGFRVWTIDQGTIPLPPSDECLSHFGSTRDSRQAGGRTAEALYSALYDLCNRTILSAEILPCRTQPARAIAQHLEAIQQLKKKYPPAGTCKDLLLLDMEQANQKTIAAIKAAGIHVLGVPEQGRRLLSEAVPETLRPAGLPADAYTELYRIRREYLSGSRTIWNLFCQEDFFSGTSVRYVQQDFFSALFLLNLLAVMEYDYADQKVLQNLTEEALRKYIYRSMRTIQQLYPTVIKMLLSKAQEEWPRYLEAIRVHMKQCVTPLHRSAVGKRRVSAAYYSR